jgi:hypothetical protein
MDEWRDQLDAQSTISKSNELVNCMSQVYKTAELVYGKISVVQGRKVVVSPHRPYAIHVAEAQDILQKTCKKVVNPSLSKAESKIHHLPL